MKFFRLSATLTATVLSLMPGFYTCVIASEPDYLCFFTTSSGEVVDLSKSLCTSKKSNPEDAANKDKEFVEAYKQQALEYPDVRDNLLASMQQSPEANIEQAKTICNQLKGGLSLDEIKEAQNEDELETASLVSTNIINDLATKYYCPEMNN
jgi:hypothetical protein